MIGWMVGAAVALGGPVLTGEPGHAFHPVWSPDGAQLAFELNRLAGDVMLYVAPVSGADAGTPVRVELPRSGGGFSSAAAVAANPVWHPTHGLVFEGTDPAGRMRLYRWTGSGRAAELVAPDQLAGDLSFPAVAGGTGLLFVGGATGAGDVRLLPQAGGRPERLTTTLASEAFPWASADGSRVLYTRRSQGAEDVFELQVRARQERVTAAGPGDQTRPVYGADESVLYFDGARGGWDIVAMTDGRSKRIARGVRLPLRARPALSPDRRWVAYAVDDPASRQIRMVRIDGSRTVSVDTEFAACGEPSLVAQGTRILLAFTALPSAEAAWRFLYVMDVTGTLTER